MHKKRLGKGLNALIPTQGKKIEDENENSKINEIDLNLIETNPYQPRKEFSLQEMDELAESIMEHGLLQPIILRKIKDKYQIIAGERRYRASKKIGVQKIKAIISEFNDQQMMELALIENLQRENLNPIEEAEAYHQLIENLDLSQAEVAKRVGKSRSTITNTLRLLKLSPQVKKYVSRETLSMGHARALLGIEDVETQNSVAEEVIRKELTVRETEKIIKNFKKETSSKEKKVKKIKKKDPNLNFVEDKLRDTLGTNVEIKAGKDKGKIVIEYYSNEDLERIIELLG